MAIERVEQRLRKVTAALNDAGIRYAVIGGNAVAVWVAKIDPAATRTTLNVDLLVDRKDLNNHARYCKTREPRAERRPAIAGARARSAQRGSCIIAHAHFRGMTEVLEGVLGFQRDYSRASVWFVDPEEPSRRSGVHLVWAGRKVRPSYVHPAPGLDESVFDAQGFRVLNLPALVRMKLTSLRDIDRVHVADMLRVGLIDDAVRAELPRDLVPHLDEIEAGIEDDE